MKKIVLLIVVFIIAACSCDETETRQTAERYWQSIKDGKLDDAKSLSINFQNLVETNMPGIASFEIGEVLLGDNEAHVKTLVSSGTEQAREVITILKKMDGEWKVDHQETFRDFQEFDVSALLNKLGSSMKKNIADFAEQMGSQIKGSVEEFGQELSTKMKESADSLEESIEQMKEENKKDDMSDKELL